MLKEQLWTITVVRREQTFSRHDFHEFVVILIRHADIAGFHHGQSKPARLPDRGAVLLVYAFPNLVFVMGREFDDVSRLHSDVVAARSHQIHAKYRVLDFKHRDTLARGKLIQGPQE